MQLRDFTTLILHFSVILLYELKVGGEAPGIRHSDVLIIRVIPIIPKEGQAELLRHVAQFPQVTLVPVEELDLLNNSLTVWMVPFSLGEDRSNLSHPLATIRALWLIELTPGWGHSQIMSGPWGRCLAKGRHSRGGLVDSTVMSGRGSRE